MHSVNHRWLRLAGAGAIGVAVILGSAGCKGTLASSGTSDTSAGGDGSAVKALDALPVKPLASKSGYSRAQFGEAWTDNVDDPDGHDGCDTRDDILRRDLADVTLESGSKCTVETGVLEDDPYTGTTIKFKRGETSSSVIQIDHLVALGDAWQTGASGLSASTRQDLANDPLELLAVSGSVNESKGDGDASDWLPANKSFDCRYVALQVAVKTRYHLWVTSAEKSAIARVLSGCPDESLPAEDGGAGSGAESSGPGTSGSAPTAIASAEASESSESSGSSSSGGSTVSPGAFCSTPGAHGVTSAGTPMVCKLDSSGSRDRWGKS